MSVKILTLFSILFLSSALAGAQDIRGTVRNEEGPLPGATIQAGPDIGVISDPDGKFVLSGLDKGNYILTIRSIGHQTITKEVSVPVKGTLEILLPTNSLGLQEVVVTGSMAPVYLKDSPVKIEVVNAKQLTTFLPSAATGIIESVSLINGVQEVVACGVCFTNSISINGLPGPYTAVLLDGSPMFGNLASVYGLNGIPASIIDRIEVIKGPNSTLYGSEAMAGVINVITKDPSEQPLLVADVMGTTHQELFTNLSYRIDAGKSTGQFGVNHAYINLFEDDNGDGFGDIVNLDRFSLFNKWDIHRKSGRKWTLAGKYYYEDRRNGVEEYLENREYRQIRGSDSVYGESIYTRRAELFGTYEFDFIPSLKADYSFSTHRQDSYYGSDQYVASQDIAFANLIYTGNTGDHQWLSGLTLRYQYYDDNTVATPDADHQFIPGIFIQDTWDISPTLDLLTGLRLDHYREHGMIFSPRLNARIEAGPATTIRANFGTGFRLVNLFTEDHAFVTGQREVVIAESLLPERSVNGSLSLNQILVLGESQASLEMDLYYTYFTNKILPDYSDPAKIIYENSGGNAITKGVAVTWNHEFAFPLSFSAGFSLQRATEETETAGSPERRQIEFAPDFTGTFSASYIWREAELTIALNSQLTGPMQLPEVYDLDNGGIPEPDPRPVRSEPFSIHSIQLTRPLSKSLTLYGGIQNIFNYKQEYSPLSGYNDPAYAPGFSDQFDTAYSFAPIHGREFYLGITWRMKK